MITTEDLQFIRQAMLLAQQGEGTVNPNPMVGALIVRQNTIIAQGYHERYGDLHAERNAFRNAQLRGVLCKGATMYVTLEPCCHHGHQPPCTEAIIEHHIARVVVGLLDPNPLVGGKGVELLRRAGIEVEVIDPSSDLAHELRYQNRVFLHYITTRRPWVLAKYAMTLDGKICTHTGDSRWVSCPASRERVHMLRRKLTAILCGIGTVLADDPMLNTRIAAMPQARNPIRIVADRHLRIPLDSQLVQSAHQLHTIVAHGDDIDAVKLKMLHDAGVETWCCTTAKSLIEKACENHIDCILLEGGGTLLEAFLRDQLVDEVYAFISPKIVGGSQAKTPVEGQGIDLMRNALMINNVKTELVGDDVLIHGTLHNQY